MAEPAYRTEIELAEAAGFAGAFAAVESGDAAAAELAEVDAVVSGLSRYLRRVGALAAEQAAARAKALAALSLQEQAAILAAEARQPPRLVAVVTDGGNAPPQILTGEEFFARREEILAREAAFAAQEALAAAPKPAPRVMLVETEVVE